MPPVTRTPGVRPQIVEARCKRIVPTVAKGGPFVGATPPILVLKMNMLVNNEERF